MTNWPGKLYPDIFGIPVAPQAPELECQTGPEIAINSYTYTFHRSPNERKHRSVLSIFA